MDHTRTPSKLKNTKPPFSSLATFTLVGLFSFWGILLAKADCSGSGCSPTALSQHNSQLNKQQHIVAVPPTHTPPLCAPQTHIQLSGDGLTAQVSLSQPCIEVGREQHVYAEVTLNGTANSSASGGDHAVPAASAIMVVIDTSGSMRGEKIETAKSALHTLLSQLNANDLVGIVTFNDHAQLLSPLVPASSAPYLHRVVDRIYANGGTNIGDGLQTAARAFSQTWSAGPVHHVRRVLLLSDGRDTYNANPYAIASEALSHSNAVISSLGIGYDYDEQFMNTIANTGHGNYAFLANQHRMADFLRYELNQARGTTAEQVALTLNFPSSWRLVRSHGATSVQTTLNSGRYEIGSIAQGAERKVFLDLLVPASREGVLGSISANISYVDARTHEHRALNADGLSVVAVTRADVAVASIDHNVVARVRAMELNLQQQEALAAWQRGDRERATEMAARVRDEARELRRRAPQAGAVLERVESEAHESVNAYGSMSSDSAEGQAFGRSSGARTRAAATSRPSASALY